MNDELDPDCSKALNLLIIVLGLCAIAAAAAFSFLYFGRS
jgi:hypothetical protein